MKAKKNTDREDLLADVAEMYYEEGKTQAEISRAIGMTRSAVSRILTEARQKGIVEIYVRRPVRFETDLENNLKKQFKLKNAYVISWQSDTRQNSLRNQLGRAAARVFSSLIKPKQVIGIAWGTTVGATIEAYSGDEYDEIKVVQLVGVLGSSRHAYSGQALVEQLALKLGGDGVYLYTPFMVDNADTARVLRNDHSVRESIAMGQNCDIALLGVGSTNPEYCSLFQGGHISEEDLNILQQEGAVGDVSGHYFDIDGNMSEVEFHQRLVGITKDDLFNIPFRVGVAGGIAKAEAILGAVSGGYLNALVTDSQTASRVLELADLSLA